MAEKKLIHVYVDIDQGYARVAIPADINEVQLKAVLRDLGYISSYRRSYLTTRVYLNTENGGVEICKGEYRSLEELGVTDGSNITIVPGDPEPRPIKNYYTDSGYGSGRVLYGCPMAKSVEEAMSQAEMYDSGESVITTGTIGNE